MKTYNVFFTRSHVRYYDYCVMLGVRAENQKEASEHVLKTLYGHGNGYYPFNRCAVEYPMTDKARAKLDKWCKSFGIKYRSFYGVSAEGKRIGYLHPAEVE